MIRDFDDFGVIVLGDPRIKTKAYGRVFLESMPPSPVLSDVAVAAQFLKDRLRIRQASVAGRAGDLMRMLALDAATEACSVALLANGAAHQPDRSNPARALR